MLLLCLLGMAALFSPAARAATFTWDPNTTGTGSDKSGTWTNGGSTGWAGGSGETGWTNSDDTDIAVFGVGGTPGTVTLSGGINAGGITFNPVASGTAYSINGSTITLFGGGAITVNSASATINSVLAGSVGLTTSGTGTLILTGANTYSGGTTINGGTLLYDLSARSGSFSVGSIAVGTSGTLTLYNTATGIDNTLLTSTTLTGSGTITKTGAGYLDLQTGSSISGFTGTLNVLAGTLGVNNTTSGASAPQASLNIASGATFDDRYNSTLAINQLTGAGTLNHSYTDSVTVTVGSSNGSSTFSGIIESTGGGILGLTKSGTGTLTLSGTNTYNGATTLNAGGLNINNASAIGTGAFTIAGGTIDNTSGGAITLSTNNAQNWNSSFTFNGSNALNLGTGAVTLSGDNTVTVAGSTLTVGGAIGGAYSLSVSGAGTLALTGASTYSGGTMINPGGTLQIGNGGSTGSLGSGNIVDNGSLVYNYISTASATLPGTNLSGSGSISVTAGGGGTGVAYADINFNGNTTLGGSMSFMQSGSNAAGTNEYEGLQVGQGATPILTASSITMFGDIGYYGGNGGSMTLNTSAYNGPVNLNISLGRADVWYNLSSFTVNSGTGTVSILGTGPESSGWAGTPVSITGVISDSVPISSSTSVTLNPTAASTLSGAFSGSMSLTDSGAGMLTLTGLNTYTGSTTINTGTLTIGGAGVLGGGNYSGSIANNATLIFASSTNQTLAGAVTGSGLTQIGNGVNPTTVNDTGGFAAISGTVTVANGSTLKINGANNLLPRGTGAGGHNGSLVVDGTLQISDGSAHTLDGTGVIAVNNGTLSTTTGNSTFGSFYIAGSQTFTLTGSNTISGPNVLGLANGATLTLNTVNAADTLLVSGQIINASGNSTGGIAKSGSGTVTLTGANSYGGATTVNAGTLITTAAFSGSSQLVVNSGTFEADSASINIVNQNAVTVNAGGTFLNLGDVVTLGNPSTNTTNLSGGILSGSNSDTTYGSYYFYGPVSVSGSVQSTINAFAITPVGAFNVAAGSNLLVSSNMLNSGGVGVTKTGLGSMILTGSSSYTGPTTINAGTLQLGNGGTTGSIANTSGISGSAGATLAFDLSTSGTFNKSISGGLNVTQAGSGALTLAGSALGYSGTTTVTNGTLIVAGAVSGNVAANGGTLVVNNTVGGNGSVLGGTLGGSGTMAGNLTVGNGFGSAASSVIWPSAGAAVAGDTTLTINGNLALNSDGAFKFTLNSSAAYPYMFGVGESDYLTVNGALGININGALLTGLDAGNSPLTLGDVFLIGFSPHGVTRTFGNVAPGGLMQIGQNWFNVDYESADTLYGGDGIELVVAAIPEPGTWATLLCGFALLIGLQRRRRIHLK